MLKRVLIAIALISFVACGKKGNPNGPDDAGSGSVTVDGSTVEISVGGSAFKPVAVVATAPALGAAGFFTFAASTVQGTSFGFAVPPNVGTYSMPGADGTNAIFIDGPASWQAVFGFGGSGSVTIKTRTSTSVTGSFDFTLLALPGTTATGTKRCVGTFTGKVS